MNAQLSRIALVLAVQPAVAVAQIGPGQTVFDTAPYDVLNEDRVEVTNQNFEPYSGVCSDADGNIYGVNPYADFVVRYSTPTPAPDLVIHTPRGPVSVACWEPTADPADRRLIVVSRGNHVATLHDWQDGRVLDLVRLDAEPGDLVLDTDNGWAFVSCSGANTVVQLDLASFTVVQRFDVQCGERPGPLYLDRGVPADPADNRIYVAGTVTGNNSTVLLGQNPTTGVVVDLDGNAGGELPDEDVCRIDPFTGTVDAVVRGSGSLQFALDRNPGTGDLWVLSSDSNNKDPNLDTEPKIKGQVVVNQLVKVPGVGATSPLVQAGAGIDLDDFDPATPGAQYLDTRSVNQARALAMHPTGLAFVASPLSDVALILDDDGERLAEIALPARSQCFAVELFALSDRVVLFLCLGTMTIEAYDWPTRANLGSMSLVLDPTPDQIRRGRDVFLDGQASADARSSCAACHPGGDTDLLGWSISGDPCDVKDVMVTQTLKGMKESTPHHWRGERELPDFLKAFGGLLGAPPSRIPTEAEMDDLVVFLQSLAPQPNPHEHPERKLDDARTSGPAPNGMAGSAVDGQQIFQTVPNFNNNTCSECHGLETGTNGNLFAEFGSDAPRAIEIEAAHLRQLEHKGLETVFVDLGSGPVEVNREGFGTAHNGSIPSLFEFVDGFLGLTDQQRTDVFRFVQQWDQGVSPACAWAVRYHQGSPAGTRGEIKRILVDGARNGWNGIVAWGLHDLGSGPQPERWAFDRALDRFVSEDPTVPNKAWNRMRLDVEAGLADLVFAGVPPEDGRRVGIDFDNDGLRNGQEAILGTDPMDPDSDDDGWWDGHEDAHNDDPLTPQATSSDLTLPDLDDATVAFAWARGAEIHWTFTEDCTYVVEYGPVGGPLFTFERKYFSRRDTCVLPHHIPSTPGQTPVTFEVKITLTDRNGNPKGPITAAIFSPDEVIHQVGLQPFLHIEEMEWVQENRTGDTLDAQVRIKVASNFFGPAFAPSVGKMVFCSLSVLNPATGDFEKSTTYTTSLPTAFDILNLNGTVSPYTTRPGPPWIVAPDTDALGETVIDFKQAGLAPGQTVKISVMGVLNEGVPPSGHTGKVYNFVSVGQMQPMAPLLEDSAELRLDF